MSLNGSMKLTNNNTSNHFIVTILFIKQDILVYLPIIFICFGVIGFIGNIFTFLQPNLRYNTCCIYLLCGSFVDVVNLFINLLSNFIHAASDNILSLINVRSLCKLRLFGLVFLPQLSIDLLILSLIDRYACTCSLTSSMRHVRRLPMVPWMIIITIIISSILSFYAPLYHDIVPGFGCMSINPVVNGIFYIVIHGFITPFVMLTFVLLTYKNVRESRRRAGSKNLTNIDRSQNPFVRMIFTQVFGTSLLSLQWIIFYMYHIINIRHIKNNEQRIIHFFIWSISNNIYYLINVKSFYLSTLTSRLFRTTFLRALIQLIPCYQKQDTKTTSAGSFMNIYPKNKSEDKSQSGISIRN